jgi:hypothetical protein
MTPQSDRSVKNRYSFSNTLIYFAASSICSPTPDIRHSGICLMRARSSLLSGRSNGSYAFLAICDDSEMMMRFSPIRLQKETHLNPFRGRGRSELAGPTAISVTEGEVTPSASARVTLSVRKRLIKK